MKFKFCDVNTEIMHNLLKIKMIHVFIDWNWYLLHMVGSGVCSRDIEMRSRGKSSWEVISGSVKLHRNQPVSISHRGQNVSEPQIKTNWRGLHKNIKRTFLWKLMSEGLRMSDLLLFFEEDGNFLCIRFSHNSICC